ncbi:MAG: hypothetical protein M1305_04685 [Candidatus Marsarchaeota archaeon]|nr:hypothetical protein [Candidatus Marsarchaeota archaeon]
MAEVYAIRHFVSVLQEGNNPAIILRFQMLKPKSKQVGFAATLTGSDVGFFVSSVEGLGFSDLIFFEIRSVDHYNI